MEIDATIKTPCTIGVFASRGAGKSVFVKNLLLNQNRLIFPIFKRVVWIYKHYQENLFQELKTNFDGDLIFENELPNFNQIEKQENTCFIIDDFMTELTNSNDVNELYVNGRHLNISLITLSQNMFNKGRYTRTMNLNTDYCVIFENIRDATIIKTLSYQMYPHNINFLQEAFEDAIKQPFGHLFIELKPNSYKPTRVRGNIFNYKDKLVVYVPVKK